jgi:phosphopantothenoylcysteine decarboxylase/phosphopantothenate--cysteine ligase
MRFGESGISAPIMSAPESPRVLVGVSGGIAAYKTPDLVRRLRRDGVAVRVVMTAGAREFVTPLTFQAVSGLPVHQDLLDPAAEAAMGHIELARWAQAILIAPATANTLARLAAGLAEDLLGTVCLASRAPLAVAPAMNQAMWAHPATAANVATLRSRGVHVWGPDSGSQACGDEGPGRMLEPETLCGHVRTLLAGLRDPGTASGPLAGRCVLVTAGPTRERIDPVRYLSNDSSGKQGFAVAAAAAEAGARVILVAGPTDQPTPPGIERVDVDSAREMLEAVLARLDGCDVFVAVAAVADFRPASVAEQKLKKEALGDGTVLTLERNPDVLATVAARSPRPFTVGFAAETEAVLENARAKRARKGADLIVANDVSDPAIGFAGDANEVTLVWADGEEALPRASKGDVARTLVARIAARLPSAARAPDASAASPAADGSGGHGFTGPRR